MIKFEVMKIDGKTIFIGCKHDKANKMSLTGIYRSKRIWKPYYASIELV